MAPKCRTKNWWLRHIEQKFSNSYILNLGLEVDKEWWGGEEGVRHIEQKKFSNSYILKNGARKLKNNSVAPKC